MFEMLLDFLFHMSCTVRLTMCMQLRCNPKAMSYSGLGGERRMPRAETWWLVGVWEWVGKKESFQRLFLAVCMCDCTFMCTHMWSRVHLCVGRRNPSSRFLSWASSCVPSTPLHTILKAGVGGFGLYKIQPTRGHRGEKPVFLYLSLYLPKLCLFPPLTECYCKSFTSYTPYSHISPSSVLVYLIWLGRSEPCICACQYGNVSVKSFGSFLSIASPRNPLGNVVLTPPLFFPLISFLFLSSQLHYFCFSMLHFCFLPNSIPFPSVFNFLQFQPVEIFCFFLL